jgi:predicted secreted acid phosphatase
VPGALEFAAEVRALGGRLVVVTNRTDEECPDTEANFRDLGLAVDATLCRPRGAPSAKDVRFAQVRTGGAAPGLGPLEVLLYLGDNILDFPGLDQGARGQSARLAEFGASYVIVPNPIYGSWQDNPRR